MYTEFLFIIPDYADSMMVFVWPILILLVTSFIHRDIQKGIVSTVIGLFLAFLVLGFDIVPPPFVFAAILAVPVIIQEFFDTKIESHIPEPVKQVFKYLVVVILILWALYTAFFMIWLLSPDEPESAPQVDFGYEYNEETRQMIVHHETGETLHEGNTEKLEIWVRRNNSIVREIHWANQSAGLPINETKSITIEGVQTNDTVSVIWTEEGTDKQQIMARFSTG